MKRPGMIAVIALAAALPAAQLMSQTALKDVAKVRDGIIYTGMAYEISQQCDSISARLFRGLNYLRSLRRHARDLGYSEAEIEAYINDDAEKDRLEGIARTQLARLGAVPGEKDSYCAVGRAQIAANTRVGWLLR